MEPDQSKRVRAILKTLAEQRSLSAKKYLAHFPYRLAPTLPMLNVVPRMLSSKKFLKLLGATSSSRGSTRYLTALHEANEVGKFQNFKELDVVLEALSTFAFSAGAVSTGETYRALRVAAEAAQQNFGQASASKVADVLSLLLEEAQEAFEHSKSHPDWALSPHTLNLKISSIAYQHSSFSAVPWQAAHFTPTPTPTPTTPTMAPPPTFSMPGAASGPFTQGYPAMPAFPLFPGLPPPGFYPDQRLHQIDARPYTDHHRDQRFFHDQRRDPRDHDQRRDPRDRDRDNSRDRDRRADSPRHAYAYDYDKMCLSFAVTGNCKHGQSCRKKASGGHKCVLCGADGHPAANCRDARSDGSKRDTYRQLVDTWNRVKQANEPPAITP